MKCQRCKAEGDNFTKNSRRVLMDGTVKYSYMCQDCQAERARKYRQTPQGKIAVYKAARKYDAKNPERRKAWEKCRALGIKPCEICDNPRTDKHHPDITKPLQIVWLCRRHHKERHRIEDT